jgi:hypothetical protein
MELRREVKKVVYAEKFISEKSFSTVSAAVETMGTIGRGFEIL